ncbi:MAG: MBL fold metallo-hydrolase [Lactobacillales bacterium]|jgi:phosphoribosyl 1,2-cyclic phosphate phosphodiesterase|nr:MBL fold metallo-hydrolase [Lactobacillales bacterium]
MKIRILGCGGSRGVPSLEYGWGACNPDNPKNRRSRTSALIETDHGNILIDTGPDARTQLLDAGRPPVHGVLYTHAHYDHLVGISDIANYAGGSKQKIPFFVPACAQDIFQKAEEFLFHQHEYFHMNVIQPYQSFTLLNQTIIPFEQEHGRIKTLGYRIGDFAYSTDVKNLNEKSFETLQGIKTWVLGAAIPAESAGHVHFDVAMQWIERLKPAQVFITHLVGMQDYDTLSARLPKHIRPCYDGLVIEIK